MTSLYKGRNAGVTIEGLRALANRPDVCENLVSLNLGSINAKEVGANLKKLHNLRNLTWHGRINTKDCQHLKGKYS